MPKTALKFHLAMMVKQ